MSGRSRWSVVAVLGLATAMMVPVSMISAGPARALEAPLSQGQQPTPAQLDALKKMYEELRARMAELEKVLGQTIGKTTQEVAAHAERLAAEQAKQADLAKHLELLKHAEAATQADVAKHLDQMRLLENAQRDEVAKKVEQMKHAQELVSKQTADRMRQIAAEQMKHKELVYDLLRVPAQLNHFYELGLSALADENATVAAGDVLRVTIGGEPDLPAAYKVTTEGTIRLPFLGAIKVVGLTAAQVRDAIGRQLAERRLGSASNVQVGILRGKR